MTQKILILDIETNSLNTSNAEIIEFGFIQTDINLNIIKSGSILIKCDVELPQNIKELLNLDKAYLNEYGSDKPIAFKKIENLIKDSEIIVCHNAIKFDFPIISSNLKNEDLFENKLTIDTIKHLPKAYYKKCENRTLKFLCIENGIYLSQAHRAMFDVVLLLSLLKKFNIQELIAKAQKKITTYSVSCHFDDKDLAKNNLGATWNADPAIKRWEIEVDEEEYKEVLKKIEQINSTEKVKTKFSLTKVSL